MQWIPCLWGSTVISWSIDEWFLILEWGLHLSCKTLLIHPTSNPTWKNILWYYVYDQSWWIHGFLLFDPCQVVLVSLRCGDCGKHRGETVKQSFCRSFQRRLNLRKGMLSFKIPAFEISKSKQIKHRNEDLPNKTSSNTYRTWERDVDGFCSLRSLLAWTWLLWSAHSSSAFALHLVKESDKYTILN